MGLTACTLICTGLVLILAPTVVHILSRVLYERARRATLVAVVGLARESAVQLLMHHDLNNCDIRVVYVPPTTALPEHATGS
ncbi:hypothetical protein [Streptomyces sp. VNUA24]|uniref:hypothetical protein n=1 Tax=Streptomyces sp. VNUA24 TaxID=3031131 RepID=UPI0023B8131C|nr:hypothetical protein [Streptomyces sp. VNUA24]WEH12258.1 hypothetical protein PYR72_00470 [Streptomyces sp. VNUA24]